MRARSADSVTFFLAGPLSLLLLVLAVLADPAFLQQVIRLDWGIGDMRPAARVAQAIFALLAILVLLWRRRVSGLVQRALRSRRQLLLGLATLVLAASLCLGLAEIVFRLLDLPFPETWTPSENAIARFDPELGWSYIPGLSRVLKLGPGEIEMPVRFDDIGARVGSTDRPRDPAAPTAIFVGGSVTMGHGVSNEESYPGVLGSMPEFPYQVVNLGVQGYGTDQAFLLLQRHLPRFNTRLVVYGFICDHIQRNAVTDRRLLNPAARFLGTKPRFALRGDGSLYLQDRPRLYEELSTSYLWAAVRLNLFRYGPLPTMDLTRAIVRDMNEYVHRHGAVLVVLDWPVRFDPRSCPAVPFAGLDVNELVLEGSVPPQFTAWSLARDNHPNPRAHRLVAQRLFDYLQRLDLLAPGNTAGAVGTLSR